MNVTNDGGPAFPSPPFTPGTLHDNAADVGFAFTGHPGISLRFASTGHPGMSLRDWFAGKALAAIPHIGCGCDLRVEEVALAAYQLADAMLKAREAKL